MDVFIIAFSLMLGIPFTIGAVGSLPNLFSSHDPDRVTARVLGCIALSFIALFTWACLAMSNYHTDPIITMHPIEEMRGIPYYFNRLNKPVEITGEGRFADPKTTQVRITVVPGGWKFGMYVTESERIELVKVAPVEK